jgi:hypothetical protein
MCAGSDDVTGRSWPAAAVEMTTPSQLAGSVPPFSTSRDEQLALSMSDTQIEMDDSVLTTGAEQLPLQQAETPDCTQAEIWSAGNSAQSPPARLQ